ncbi:hypothetical protein [Erythrobacter sp.]|uniref:TA system antitoxin ParD family protein n=1 Tax=Erythrobacter sp. TaxID=1042 RepID=UPI0025D47724|nr:hypothetical protein [Erythrobacter sp.]
MARSIKLADEIMDEAEIASALHCRSLAGQITHWVRIGKAIEKSNAFSHERISAVLAGKAPTTTLSEEEYAVWADSFEKLVTSPTPQSKAFFAERRRLGVGSGLDENGNFVQAADLLNKRGS